MIHDLELVQICWKGHDRPREVFGKWRLEDIKTLKAEMAKHTVCLFTVDVEKFRTIVPPKLQGVRIKCDIFAFRYLVRTGLLVRNGTVERSNDYYLGDSSLAKSRYSSPMPISISSFVTSSDRLRKCGRFWGHSSQQSHIN